ncbi:MAG: non-hydrolyzing UDP-N-acetylglucosamine 2-epimerase [Ignavibacteriales bacterium]
MRILTVVGARPQFIKSAAVSRVLRATPGVVEILVHTGQHYDKSMSQVFFDQMDIALPDYNLQIGSGKHGWQTGRMVEAIETVILQEMPDWVLVYGDTNSTLAGALAAVKLCIRVAHVEAGLRSYNRKMPEEINRVLTDHASDLLLAPTIRAVKNLDREGLPEDRVRMTGDVMLDASMYYGAKAEAQSRILEHTGLVPGQYLLGTIHRAENTDDVDRLAAIFEGFAMASRNMDIVIPLHPRTQAALARHESLTGTLASLRVIQPVGYLDMLMLEKNARIIATDSGGVQKEAFFYGVPCVTLREETEWVETVESGWNRVIPPTDPVVIADALGRAAEMRGEPGTPYGTGHAAEAVVESLMGH